MKNLNISSKFAFIISAITSSIFFSFSIYKGIILYFVNSAMEDTFVGGNASDISITLWFTISGIMVFMIFIFIYFIKIKDLKSQKILLIGITIIWLIVSVSLVVISLENFLFAIPTLVSSIVCYLSTLNLKKQIIKELNKKGLSPTEIHLLQKLAGIDKK